MYEPYLGCIVPWAGSYAPQGWAYCFGTSLSIREYPALFAIIGTTYGGDGVNTFQLPNLTSLMISGAAMGTPQPGGRIELARGEINTVHTAVVNGLNLPVHTHSGTVSAPVVLPATSTQGGPALPGPDSLLAAGTVVRGDATLPYLPGTGTVSLAGGPTGTITATLQSAGTVNAMVVDTAPPYVVISYIIAIEGDFPVRPN